MKLLLLVGLFSSVQSCRTISESGVTLTGVCPNDSFTVPIGKVLNYECSYTFSGSFLVFWNISGDIIPTLPPSGISVSTNSDKSTLTITTKTTNTVQDIQCLLCNLTLGTNCILPTPNRFIGTESVRLITFGML